MRSISMVFSLYVSNKIGSEAVGTFGLVMSVYMFFVTITTSGIGLACTCIVSEQFSNNNFVNGLKAVKSCIIFSLLLGLGCGLVVLIFSNTIASIWLKSVISSKPLILIAAGLPFISISSVLNGYFTAVRKGYKTAISQSIELFIKIIATIILLNFYANKSLESVCVCLTLADVTSEICSFALIFILYKKDSFKYAQRAISGITFKRNIFKIAFPVSATSCIRSGLSTLKQFIIPSRLMLFGLTYNMALSEYGKINGMTMAVITFPTVFIISFSNLLVPEFTSLAAKQYKKRILEVCKKVLSATSLFSIVLYLIFFLFADKISLLIFRDLECVRYIKVLSPIVLFIYTDNVLDSMLKGLNKQFSVMICNIIDLILTISILYFALPTLGITGYLLSIMVSEIFNFCVSYYQLYKATGFTPTASIICCYLFFALLAFYNLV